MSTEPARVDDDTSPAMGPDPTGSATSHLALVRHNAGKDSTRRDDTERDVTERGVAGRDVTGRGVAGRDVTVEPEPETLARGLALCVAEIMAGARELDTIARWITEDVHRHLMQRVHVAARARSVARRTSTRPALRVGSVVVDRPTPDVVETAVVLHGRARSRAVAIRLERSERGWRATTIAVL